MPESNVVQDQELLGFVVLERDIHGEYDMPLGLGLLFLPDDRESAEASLKGDQFIAEVRRVAMQRGSVK